MNGSHFVAKGKTMLRPFSSSEVDTASSPTGRRFRHPEPQELPNYHTTKDPEEAAKANHQGAGSAVDYSENPCVGMDFGKVERSVVVLVAGRIAPVVSYMEELEAYCKADVAKAFMVPEELLGQPYELLGNDELQSIRDNPLDFMELPEPKRRGRGKNPFAEETIKRFHK